MPGGVSTRGGKGGHERTGTTTVVAWVPSGSSITVSRGRPRTPAATSRAMGGRCPRAQLSSRSKSVVCPCGGRDTLHSPERRGKRYMSQPSEEGKRGKGEQLACMHVGTHANSARQLRRLPSPHPHTHHPDLDPRLTDGHAEHCTRQDGQGALYTHGGGKAGGGRARESLTLPLRPCPCDPAPATLPLRPCPCATTAAAHRLSRHDGKGLLLPLGATARRQGRGRGQGGMVPVCRLAGECHGCSHIKHCLHLLLVPSSLRASQRKTVGRLLCCRAFVHFCSSQGSNNGAAPGKTNRGHSQG